MRSPVTHNFTDDKEIKIKDEECLLFIEISGTGEDIKEEDFIILRHTARKIKYLVYNIEFNKNKFSAKLIMLNYED